MDNYEKNAHLVEEAVEQKCAFLQPDPFLAQRVLNAANEKGEVKMKRKISVGLAVILALMLMSVTALAAALLWQQQVVPMKEIEQTEGDYAGWPISQKQVLIRALIDSGVITAGNETDRLFDEATNEAEKHTIADQILLTLTGQTDVKEISVDIITYAVMGPTDTWTAEQRVWWQDVTQQFYGDDGAPDVLINASPEVISEADAIRIAKDALVTAYGWSQSTLDNALVVADLYVTEQRPDYKRWNVQFKFYREGSDNYLERVYVVIVDENGQVVDDPDMGIIRPQASLEAETQLGRTNSALYQTIYAMAGRINSDLASFGVWPLELQSEYSEIVAPQVRAIVESGDLTPLINGEGPDLFVIAASKYTYGVPSDADMEQAPALAIAKNAMMEKFGLESSIVDLYGNISVYFDITDPSAPLWKFVFSPSSRRAFPGGYDNPQSQLLYKVEINAQTGTVECAEEFEFQILGNDLDYMLRLY
ncbi:MAG: hypothetical protein J1E43_07650 [Christensenellaceae bacterium]|nr:hypothetical protein [Christensenellaceae bacterium]